MDKKNDRLTLQNSNTERRVNRSSSALTYDRRKIKKRKGKERKGKGKVGTKRTDISVYESEICY